jgi:hypothetical protein
MGALPFAEGAAEIEGDAADEERGIATGRLEQLGGEVRRRRLAVGAGDRDAVALRDRELVERVREGAIREPGLDRGDRLGIVLAHGIADHDEVGPIGQHVRRREALDRDDAPVGERRAHRRIELLVRAGDPDAAGLQQSGEGAHAGPADGDEMDVAQAARVVGALMGGRRHREGVIRR